MIIGYFGINTLSRLFFIVVNLLYTNFNNIYGVMFMLNPLQARKQTKCIVIITSTVLFIGSVLINALMTGLFPLLLKNFSSIKSLMVGVS